MARHQGRGVEREEGEKEGGQSWLEELAGRLLTTPSLLGDIPQLLKSLDSGAPVHLQGRSPPVKEALELLLSKLPVEKQLYNNDVPIWSKPNSPSSSSSSEKSITSSFLRLMSHSGAVKEGKKLSKAEMLCASRLSNLLLDLTNIDNNNAFSELEDSLSSLLRSNEAISLLDSEDTGGSGSILRKIYSLIGLKEEEEEDVFVLSAKESEREFSVECMEHLLTALQSRRRGGGRGGRKASRPEPSSASAPFSPYSEASKAVLSSDTTRKIIGPQRPSAQEDFGSREARKEEQEEDEEEEEEVGPIAAEAYTSSELQRLIAVNQARELSSAEAALRKKEEEGDVREEWMLSPGERDVFESTFFEFSTIYCNQWCSQVRRRCSGRVGSSRRASWRSGRRRRWRHSRSRVRVRRPGRRPPRHRRCSMTTAR